MRVTVTGASGLIGGALVAALAARECELTILARDPARSLERLRETVPAAALETIEAVAWEPLAGPAPTDALAGRDAVVSLAGEPIHRRWTAPARRAIRESRELGTRNLVAGLRAAALRAHERPPPALVSASAIAYYGNRGDEPLDEEAAAGSGFLAGVCAAWERAAASAERHGSRVVLLRIGVVLDPRAGALATMVPPFAHGLGGPVGRGRQYVSWIHRDDLVALTLDAIAQRAWAGPFNATAPRPVTNAELARTLGSALGRRAALPIPGLALRLRYGAVASVITGGARVLPARALVAGFQFRHPELNEALRDLLGDASGGHS